MPSSERTDKTVTTFVTSWEGAKAKKFSAAAASMVPLSSVADDFAISTAHQLAQYNMIHGHK
jgi:hypothetical protein